MKDDQEVLALEPDKKQKKMQAMKIAKENGYENIDEDANDDDDEPPQNIISALGSSMDNLAILTFANLSILQQSGIQPIHIIGYVPLNTYNNEAVVLPAGAIRLEEPHKVRSFRLVKPIKLSETELRRIEHNNHVALDKHKMQRTRINVLKANYKLGFF